MEYLDLKSTQELQPFIYRLYDKKSKLDAICPLSQSVLSRIR